MSQVLLLQMNERFDEQLVKDEIGNLDDFELAVGFTYPAVANSLTGRGRLFEDTLFPGIEAEEAVVDSTRLLRDCTIIALIAWDDFDASDMDNVLIQRGSGGSDAERVLWGARLITGADPFLQMFWQTAAGVDEDATAVAFDNDLLTPGVDFIQVAFIREWVSTTEVIVTYMVNDVVIGQVTSTVGDIGNGIGGGVHLGYDPVAAQNHFHGTMDSIVVYDEALAPEFIRHDFRRINKHQPEGYQIIRSLAPPGKPRPLYSESPDSIVQREFAIEGDAIGHAYSKAEQLKDLLPDKPYDPALLRWEGVYKLRTFQRDTIDTRRTRLGARTQNVRGYSNEDIPVTFTELLDQLPADVDIRNFSNLYSTLFDEAVDADPDLGWTRNPGNGTLASDVTWQAADEFLISVGALANVGWTAADKGAPQLLRSCQGEGVDISASVGAWLASGNGLQHGIFVLNFETLELTFLGVGLNGATDDLVVLTFRDGLFTTTVLEVSVTDDPMFLRMTGNADDAGGFRVMASSVGIDGPYDVHDSIQAAALWPNDTPEFCGITVMHTGTVSTGAGSAAFDDFRLWQPRGRRPYLWYIYRDLLLPGDPDLVGAQAQYKTSKPSHTDGAVITELKPDLGDQLLGIEPFNLED